MTSKVYEELIGKVIINITGAENGSNEIIITFDDDTKYHMYHHRECCEDVYIEDVIGDISDLINHPLYMCEEVTEDDPKDTCILWTFYKFATVKGYVTIRWYGESRYYSTTVDFEKIK